MMIAVKKKKSSVDQLACLLVILSVNASVFNTDIVVFAAFEQSSVEPPNEVRDGEPAGQQIQEPTGQHSTL